MKIFASVVLGAALSLAGSSSYGPYGASGYNQGQGYDDYAEASYGNSGQSYGYQNSGSYGGDNYGTSKDYYSSQSQDYGDAYAKDRPKPLPKTPYLPPKKQEVYGPKKPKVPAKKGYDYSYKSNDYQSNDYGYESKDYGYKSKDHGYKSKGYKNKGYRTKGSYKSKGTGYGKSHKPPYGHKQQYSQDYNSYSTPYDYNQDYSYNTCVLSSDDTTGSCANHCYAATSLCLDACKPAHYGQDASPQCTYTCITKQASCLQHCTCLSPGSVCTQGAKGQTSCCLSNGEDSTGLLIEGCTQYPAGPRCCLPNDGSACDIGMPGSANSQGCCSDGTGNLRGNCDIGGSGYSAQRGCCVRPGHSCHQNELCCQPGSSAALQCPTTGNFKNVCCLADGLACSANVQCCSGDCSGSVCVSN